MDAPAQDTTTAGASGRTVTFGDYEIGERRERRASADVYAATHLPTRTPRLIYVLRPTAMENHPFVHQVVCEVDAARWLRHPIVAKVDGYGDTPSRRMYVAVERPQMPSLEELLAVQGRMAPRRVVRFATRLVEALDEAHALGLVHGRLTPAAVHVAAEEEGQGDPAMTLTGLGTGAVSLDGELLPMERRYVSPEQQLGREADVRSDVFGLASLLYHAIVGSAPPDAGAAMPVLSAEQTSVVAVLAAARSPDPADRPASVKAFWMDLLAALVDAAAVEPARRESALDLALDRGRAPMGILTPIGKPARAPEPPVVLPAAVAPAPAPPPVIAAPRPVEVERPAAVRILRDDPTPVTGDLPVAELPRAAATADAARRVTLSVPSISARARRRTALLHLLWLAVPAAAAAAVWPSGPSGAHQTQDGLAPILSDVGVQPQEPEVEYEEAPPAPVATPLPPPGPPRDSTPRRVGAPRVREVALPSVAIPAVEIEQPFRVRPEDFSKGVSRGSGGR